MKFGTMEKGLCLFRGSMRCMLRQSLVFSNLNNRKEPEGVSPAESLSQRKNLFNTKSTTKVHEDKQNDQKIKDMP